MERQYYSQRFRYLPDGRQVGTIDVGDIIYIQDGVRPFSFPGETQRRVPWRVEAWIPREAMSWNPANRRARTVRCAGGHLALVRSLRDSRRVEQVADWILLACVDAGFVR
jgi:hypothetical protein